MSDAPKIGPTQRKVVWLHNKEGTEWESVRRHVPYIRADAPELVALRGAISDDLFDVLDEAIKDNFAVENEYGGDEAEYQAYRAKIESVHERATAALAAFDALVEGR